ncbi:uncharacterized protein M6B38_252535 [Iris pallida]|uniref:Uncharacterized protein n=1 Tax=Iris pallida TaxID=29817 RepID=A0AAX6IIT0_IRIPA|nr:uncharacterized protein M6B38_252535 [Iris pallida]
MELDFFEFENDHSPNAERFVEEEEEEDEEQAEATAAESKAFWEEQHQLLKEAMSRTSSTEARIRRDTEEALRRMGSAGDLVCTCSRECRRNCVLNNIVERLRNAGYDSAICKSKWLRSPDIPSGEHIYTDVVVEPKDKKKAPVRVVIELNFRSEFEMARGSRDYNSLVARLPEVFVGKPERLRGVVKVMCAAAKRCMKENKMHMAPWRKHKYMQSKWLGTCERTLPPSLPLPAVVADRTSSRPARPRASMLTFDLHFPAVEVV